MLWAKEGKKRDRARDCIPEMFVKTQSNCRDATVCMAVAMVDCRCTRCEDLLCRNEEEQAKTIEVFNCDQVQGRMFTLLDKTKNELP